MFTYLLDICGPYFPTMTQDSLAPLIKHILNIEDESIKDEFLKAFFMSPLFHRWVFDQYSQQNQEITVKTQIADPEVVIESSR